MAEIVGEFKCGNCAETVPLKKDNKQKFYYVCSCGQHFMRGPEGANVVLSKGVIFGNGPAQEKPREKPREKAQAKPRAKAQAKPAEVPGDYVPPKAPVRQAAPVVKEKLAPTPARANNTFFRG